MNIQLIFLSQFVLSLLVYSVLAHYELVPRLNKLSTGDALFWLTVPHAFRHIGLVFLVPGVVYQPLPESFAGAAAYGDLAAGMLALITLVALRSNWTAAIALVWVTHAVGTVDLANALRQAEAIPGFGAAWYIPTFIVPALLVTHFLSFKRLLGRA